MNDTTAAIEDGEFLALLRPYLKVLTDPGALSLQSNLYDLGLDSTAALSLLFDLEERYGVTFPEALLTDDTFETGAALKSALGRLLARG